jgi:hypothetical protein
VLKVLTQGDPTLYAKACQTVLLCAGQIGLSLKRLRKDSGWRMANPAGKYQQIGQTCP